MITILNVLPDTVLPDTTPELTTSSRARASSWEIAKENL